MQLGAKMEERRHQGPTNNEMAKKRKTVHHHRKDTKRKKLEKEEEAWRMPAAIEMDEHRLKQRQKQIDYGKNTNEYDNYLRQVPLHRRQRHHMRTPDKNQRQSKRSWDHAVRSWRKYLHQFDDKQIGQENAPGCPPDESPPRPRSSTTDQSLEDKVAEEALALPSIFDGFDDNNDDQDEEIDDEDDLL